jgi:hypothetical protein
MAKNPDQLAETLQVRIREAAYLLWEAGGRRHGRSLEYWLAAESSLRDILDAASSSEDQDRRPVETSTQPSVAGLTQDKTEPAGD